MFKLHSCNPSLVVVETRSVQQCLQLFVKRPRVGPGHPSSPCPFTSSSFPPFTFLFLSLALPIFFFCPSLPFLPKQSHSVSRPQVVGGDRTWVQFVFCCVICVICIPQLRWIVVFCTIWFSLVQFCVFLQCVDTVGWVI